MPSNDAKQRWNAAHYTQVKVSVNPDVAASFKAACAANDKSQAFVLSKFMAEYCEMTPDKTKKPGMHEGRASPFTLETRKKRRAAVKAIAARLEDVLAAEERFYDSVPDNLHGSKWHEASETSISIIQEILDLLSDIYA
jgi:hypothetical protein